MGKVVWEIRVEMDRFTKTAKRTTVNNGWTRGQDRDACLTHFYLENYLGTQVARSLSI